MVTMDEEPTIHTTCGRRSDRIPEQKLKTEREKMKSEGSKANKKKWTAVDQLRTDISEGASRQDLCAVPFPHGRIVLVSLLPTSPGLH